MRDLPRACRTIAELEIGDRFELAYSISDDDLEKFASVSGDWNPVHFDEAYAASSMFGERIAHGLISLAKFSGIFGMDLPGLGTLWETQEVRFIAPVYLERPYKAVAELIAKERRRAVFSTWVEDEGGARVLEGKGVVIPISEAIRSRMSPAFLTTDSDKG